MTSSVELNDRPNPNKEFLLTIPNPLLRINLFTFEINNFSDLKMLRSSSICASPVYKQALFGTFLELDDPNKNCYLL